MVELFRQANVLPRVPIRNVAPLERVEVIQFYAPKPASFKGNRDAKEVENFLRQVEQYLEHQNVQDENTRIRTATLYLADNAAI